MKDTATTVQGSVSEVIRKNLEETVLKLKKDKSIEHNYTQLYKEGKFKKFISIEIVCDWLMDVNIYSSQVTTI